MPAVAFESRLHAHSQILSCFPATLAPCELQVMPQGAHRLHSPTHPLQANFESLQALIDRIHRDAEVSKEALAHPQYQQQKEDPFLLPATANSGGAAGDAAGSGEAAGAEQQQ